MKKVIYDIISGLFNTNWNISNKVKVLIETNSYFTKKQWENVFIGYNLQKSIEVKYFSNKYKGYKLVKQAQVMFSFGENAFYEKRNVGLQYYGVSQPIKLFYKIPEVYYAKGFSSQAIAEYCLAYSMIIINKYANYFKNQTLNKWSQLQIINSNTSLIDKKIGILGLGNNGKKIAVLFKRLGCTVYGFDIKKDKASVVDVFCNSLDNLFSESDILIITLNLTKDTANIVNKHTLSLMRASSYLINVSRGEVVNEDDLYKLLKAKKIAGAVLDVTVNEPLSRYNKLWKLNNLIITPHISGNVNKFCLEVMTDFCDKLNHYIKNRNV
jgi:phosphoglycerate dehydrogenase-like enzyme